MVQAETADLDRQQLLYRLAGELTSSLDLDEVLSKAMDGVIRLMNAARGFIVLVGGGNGEMEVRISRNLNQEGERKFGGSRTVIENVVRTGQPVVTTDASADDRFKAQTSVVMHNLRSILAVPLVVKGRVIGAVYCDNPFRSGIFGERDMGFLQGIADQAAIAIENARLHSQLRAKYEESDHLRRTFERYVNRQVMDRVLADPQGGFLAGECLEVTILASDIAGFSALSRELAAEDMVGLLNDYFARMVDIAIDHGGNIDKFQGDGLLVVFGAPVPLADPARSAVAAAMAMGQALGEFNQSRAALGRPPLEVGFGLDTGKVVAGNLGSERRLEYTVIGVPVNNAAYLSKRRPAGILMSHNTYQGIGQVAAARAIDPLILKGAASATPIYQVDP